MNSRKTDYYRVLNLNGDCTPHDIKKSYRALALKWHPDKHLDKTEANSKFNEIREAYSVLTDPKLRKIYDLYGHQGVQKYQENNASPDHPNAYLAKGFKGTRKSAFDILWDILQEKEDDSSDETDSSDKMPSDFKTDFFGLFGSRAASEVDEDHFLNNYQPTFLRSEFSVPPQEYTSLFTRKPSSDLSNTNQNTPSCSTANSQTNTDKLRTNTGLFVELLSPKSKSEVPGKLRQVNSSNINSPNVPLLQKKASVIIIDDDDEIDFNKPDHSQQPVSPWIAELNEFQTILDQFHYNLEESLLNFNKVNPNSKKISKREKLIPSSQSSKNVSATRLNSRSIPIFS